MGSSTAPSWMSRNRWSLSMGKRISPEELESLSGEALAKEDDPRILKAKIRELETLAAAWEQEARDQSTKCLELEGRNKEASRVQRQRDLAMKDVARSQKRIEALEHEMAELQAANAALHAKLEAHASESEDGSRRPSSSRLRTSARTSVDDERLAKIEKLRSDGDKGRLGLPAPSDNKARQHASSSPERQSASRERKKDLSSRRTSTAEVQEKTSPSRRRLSATEQKPSSSRRGSTAVSRSPAPPAERPSREAKSGLRRASTAQEAPKTPEEAASLPGSPSVAEGGSAEPRGAAELPPGALKKELLAQELPIPASHHVGAASPRSLEEDPHRSHSSDTFREVAAHYFSMYSDELAKWTLEGIPRFP
ncbi:olpB [Symbiodinium sp. CCMP2456]|nr:olpB [Symbiodinium sp. CCMP2456]